MKKILFIRKDINRLQYGSQELFIWAMPSLTLSCFYIKKMFLEMIHSWTQGKKKSVKAFYYEIPQLHPVGLTMSWRREDIFPYSSSEGSSRWQEHLIFLTFLSCLISYVVVFLFAHSLLHLKTSIFYVVNSSAQKHIKLPWQEFIPLEVHITFWVICIICHCFL